MRYFSAAPSTRLKLISSFGIVVLLAISYQAKQVAPAIEAGEFTHYFGLVMSSIPPLLLLCCLLGMVRGYSISPNYLYIHRLLWKTAIPLTDLYGFEFAPEKLKCSTKLIGNGGLFAFTGWYQSKALGRYRLFATDFNNAITLFFHGRTLVITPQLPRVFISSLRTLRPELTDYTSHSLH